MTDTRPGQQMHQGIGESDCISFLPMEMLALDCIIHITLATLFSQDNSMYRMTPYVVKMFCDGKKYYQFLIYCFWCICFFRRQGQCSVPHSVTQSDEFGVNPYLSERNYSIVSYHGVRTCKILGQRVCTGVLRTHLGIFRFAYKCYTSPHRFSPEFNIPHAESFDVLSVTTSKICCFSL